MLGGGGARRVAAVACACASLLCAAGPAAAAADPASEVDPRIGTLLPGFVFPGAVVPFGMVQNSPDTASPLAYGGYMALDPTIRGFSLVHLSGPGVAKGGDLPFMPTTGDPVQDPAAYGEPFTHLGEHAEPGYYRVRLLRSLVDVELTASTRAAMQRYRFPPTARAHVIVDVTRSVEGVHRGAFRVTGPDEISGWTRGRYPVFFVARFSRPFTASGTFRSEGEGAGGWVRFDATRDPEVTVRIGLSFVDEDGARRNLEAEAPDGMGFDGMRAAARAAWNRELGRIRISGGTAGARRSFHTALYHAFLHPNVHTDADGRYRGFDDAIHVARGRTQYANFSSWDLYKSQNQLLALVVPDRYRDMMLSLLDDARRGGKLPRWGEQTIDAAHMSGDPTVPAIAEAVCRGLLRRDDAEALYAAAVGLQALRPPELDRLGFLPGRAGTTLEYGVADFALALIARALGREDEARRWLEQSLRYRNVQDPVSGFVRPRDGDGSWPARFEPTEETGFQEGNSWQYSWLAPHDAAGLFERMGGRGIAAGRLDRIFSLPPEGQSVLNVFGLRYQDAQWAPGNEHDLQVPWMHVFTGRPWRVADTTRDARRLYRPDPGGLPGNDDLGGLSAWHVLNALGLGPVTPGAPFWVVGSPHFPHAAIDVHGGRTLVVEARGTSDRARYVQGATLDGAALDRGWIPDAALRGGGRLVLRMGRDPSRTWGTADDDLPPSASTHPLGAFGCAPVAPRRLRVSVTPRRVRAGRTARLRVRVRTGAGVAAVGARVRLGGRSYRTGSSGTVTIARRFAGSGTRRVAVDLPGARRATARVIVVRAQRAARLP